MVWWKRGVVGLGRGKSCLGEAWRVMTEVRSGREQCGDRWDVLSECTDAVRVCVKASVVARGGEPKLACLWDRQTLQLGAVLRSRPLPQA